MNTVCLDRERAEAVAYLKTRLLPDAAAGWPEADWDAHLLDHLRRREPARLPFTPARLPEIARLAARYDPAENEWDAEIAAEARAGRSLGAANPYCRRFLELPGSFDFSAYPHEDPQTIHGLNRHRWFASLARRYWTDADPAWLESLFAHWDFFSANVAPPHPELARLYHGIGKTAATPPWHELDVFIRQTNWYWAFWLSLPAPAMTPARCAVLLARCLRQFDMVAGRGINNHRHNFTAMQLESVYLWAASLPEVGGMATWRHFARNTLESSLRDATTPDGLQWERSLGYHEGCLRWYGFPYLVGRRFGDDWSPDYGERLRHMAEVIDALVTPDGNTPLVSDSDRVANWKGPLALARCLFPDMTFRNTCAPAHGSLWASDGMTWEPAGAGFAEPFVKVFPNGGIATVRNTTTQLIVDNGPNGAGHCHKCNLAIHYEALGRPVLVDPGRAVYRPDTDRNWVIMPNSHNLPVIENAPVSAGVCIPASGIGVVPLAGDPRLGPFVTGVTAAQARITTSFGGYVADPTARVTRSVYLGLDEARPWLVVEDALASVQEHNWTHSWLFPAAQPMVSVAEGWRVRLDNGLHVALAAWSAEGPLTAREEAMFWFPNYGEKSPARWLRLSGRASTFRRIFAFAVAETPPDFPRFENVKDAIRVARPGCSLT